MRFLCAVWVMWAFVSPSNLGSADPGSGDMRDAVPDQPDVKYLQIQLTHTLSREPYFYMQHCVTSQPISTR